MILAATARAAIERPASEKRGVLLTMLQVKFKVPICGEASVGKTCLVLRFTENKFMETKSTIGVAFAIKDVQTKEQGKIRLQLCDFAGEERFRTLLGPFCIGSSGAILLFDLNWPDSFKGLDEWMEIIRANTGEGDKLGTRQPIPVVLAGTKKDLCKDAGRPVKKERIDAFMKKHGITSYHEISSKTGENVEQVFADLVKQMLANNP
nr:Rab family GTPase [Candidatus Sigynarchaeum springense]